MENFLVQNFGSPRSDVYKGNQEDSELQWMMIMSKQYSVAYSLLIFES